MLKVPLIKPSTEKILREFELMEILELILLINSEKQIEFLKRFSPKFRIAKEILEFKSKNSSRMKNEKFMLMPKNN